MMPEMGMSITKTRKSSTKTSSTGMKRVNAIGVPSGKMIAPIIEVKIIQNTM
jgi:hypothetical protein